MEYLQDHSGLPLDEKSHVNFTAVAKNAMYTTLEAALPVRRRRLVRRYSAGNHAACPVSTSTATAQPPGDSPCGPAADDVQVQIQLGRRGQAERAGRRRYHEPDDVEPGGKPFSTFDSIGATWSFSGFRLRARCHWKRASLWRPTRQ